MNNHRIFSLFVVIGLLLSAGCSSPTPTRAPNVDATVAAAVAATDVAKVNQQATVNSAVAATAAAIPTQTPLPTQTALPTYTPQPTNPPIPTLAPQPSPTVVNVSAVSQQEMANAVDSSVQQANSATQQTATYTNQVAIDGVLTAQEVQLLLSYAGLATEEINQAYALAEQYLALYGELAEETLALLTAIEKDLNSMAQSMSALTATLDEINKAIQQGQAVSQEAIKKLQTQAEQANAKAQETKTKLQTWSKSVQTELDKRVQTLTALKPSQVATDRSGAIKQLQDYIGALKGAFADGKFSKAELNNVIQLGVNAGASLKAVGGVGTAQLPDAINTLNQQLARGQLPQAKSGLANLDAIAPKRP